jgi:hypothetical protein
VAGRGVTVGAAFGAAFVVGVAGLVTVPPGATAWIGVAVDGTRNAGADLGVLTTRDAGAAGGCVGAGLATGTGDRAPLRTMELTVASGVG